MAEMPFSSTVFCFPLCPQDCGAWCVSRGSPPDPVDPVFCVLFTVDSVAPTAISRLYDAFPSPLFGSLAVLCLRFAIGKDPAFQCRNQYNHVV